MFLYQGMRRSHKEEGGQMVYIIEVMTKQKS